MFGGVVVGQLLGGWIAQTLGYKVAFYILGNFAPASLALWIVFAGTIRGACEGSGDAGAEQAA